jgi:HAD superfamily hydrolase (TIGR01509 family)
MTGKAVLFDLGDTLVDLGEGRGSYEARVLHRAGHVYDVLATAGLSLPDRAGFCHALATDSEAQYHVALAQLKGIDVYEIMQRFLRQNGLPAEDGLTRLAGDAYCEGGGDAPSPLRAGALETLAELHAAGWRIGAISNTIQPPHHMNASLIRRGLARFMEVQVYSSAAGVAKPHPAIFRSALDALGVRPDEAAYVGDRLAADVGGAQAAGMKGILVEVGHRSEISPDITPDARIRELPELPGVLPGLWR